MFPLTVDRQAKWLLERRSDIEQALYLTLRDPSAARPVDMVFYATLHQLTSKAGRLRPTREGAYGHSREDKPRNPRARKRRRSKLWFRKLPQQSPACGSSSIPKNARLLNVPNARRSRKASAATQIMSLHAVALIDLLTVEVERVLRRQREIGAHD